MAQGRFSEPSREDQLTVLQKDLTSLVQTFSKEQRELETLEQQILTSGEVKIESLPVLAEDSWGEALYEKIAPHFISATAFLKHLLAKTKEETMAAETNLHNLLQISHADFATLTSEEKHRYSLYICFLASAILQDLNILANKFSIELEVCITDEMLEEIVIEKVVNGVATILLDKELYHPDHDKQLADYRQQLYLKIAKIEMSTQDFFSLMLGHVAAAMEFVKTHLPELSQEKDEQKPVKRAIRQTLLAPPAPIPTMTSSVVSEQQPAWRCTIL